MKEKLIEEIINKLKPSIKKVLVQTPIEYREDLEQELYLKIIKKLKEEDHNKLPGFFEILNKNYKEEALIIKINEHDRLMLYKNDLEDLMKRDLTNEGYTEQDFPEKIPERKKELAKALLKMVKESDEEFDRGEFTSLEDLKKELNDEGIL